MVSPYYRKRRYEGYTGWGYSESPMGTTTGKKFIAYLQWKGTDLHKEMKLAETGESKYFDTDTSSGQAYGIRINEIQPTDDELERGIIPLDKIFHNVSNNTGKFIIKHTQLQWVKFKAWVNYWK